jgi:uncharacterized repeat protein (TIGR01451 family)
MFLPPGASVNVSNSIFVTNTSSQGPDVSGAVGLNDHNIVGNSSGSSGFAPFNGNLLDAATTGLQLAPLGSYGGPTQTMPLLLGSTGIDAGSTPPPSTFGLQDWYQGQNNAADSAGSNPGTTSGGVTYTAGAVGQAFKLDGTTGKVIVSNTPALNATAFTVGGWFNLSQAPATGATADLASKYDGLGNGWVLSVNSGRVPSFSLFTPTFGNLTVGSATALPLNTWHYLAATFDGQHATFYVDGKAVSNGTLSGSFTPSTTPLMVGAASWTNSNYTAGAVDQLVFYSRPLAASEVQSLYNGSAKAVPSVLPGLNLWLAAENNTADSAGPAPGTINGGVSYTSGRVGQAFNFNGSSSYVDLGTNADIVGMGPFSVGAWIKTTAANGVILNQRDAQQSNGEYQLAISSGKAYWWTFGNGQYGFNFTSNASVNDGKWHYITATKLADGTGQIWIDGTLDSSQAATSVPLGSGIHVYIGEDVRNAAFAGYSPNNFIGQIDEVQIYNRSLTSSEIHGLFTSPGTGFTTDQRGFSRSIGTHIDVGATEYQYDLAVSGKAPSRAYIGSTATYTLTVINNGPDAVPVNLSDSLPPSLLFQSLTVPVGWATAAPPVGQSGLVSVTSTGSLTSGESATFTLVVQVSSGSVAGTVIKNTVTVGRTGNDNTLGNNTVTFSTTAQTQPVGVDIHGQPSNTVVGQPIAPGVLVAVVDGSGSTLPNSTTLVTLSIASGPPGATLRGTTTVRAVDGVAIFNNLVLDQAGTYTLEASSGTLTPDFSNPFVVSPTECDSRPPDRPRRRGEEHGWFVPSGAQDHQHQYAAVAWPAGVGAPWAAFRQHAVQRHGELAWQSDRGAAAEWYAAARPQGADYPELLGRRQ